jgi:hypothetical protein
MEVTMMHHHGKFASFTFYCAFMTLIILLWIIHSIASQSKEPHHPKFDPPLKGTEILLEADIEKSKLRRRGIWALDPMTGKTRFLIPNGSRPFWSPKRNYFSYQDHNHIKIVNKKGKIQASFCSIHTDGYLAGWGHNEKWIIYIAPCSSSTFLPSKEDPYEEFGYFQTIYFLSWNPLKLSLVEAGAVDLTNWFSMHPLHHIGTPSISPDGKQIVFEVFKYAPGIGKFYSKIFVADLVESERVGNTYLLVKNIRRLTRLPEEIMEINPRWSPDGNQIAFEIVTPQKGNLVTHIINREGNELKGLRLYLEEIKITTDRGSFRAKETLLEIKYGLVTECYLNHSLRVVGWLSKNRIVVADLEYKLTRYPDLIDYSFNGLRSVWIVDLEQKHPPVLLLVTGPGSLTGQGRFLCLSKNRLVLTSMVDDFLIALDLYEIPEYYDKALQIIHKHKSIIKQLFHHFLKPNRSLVVYWMNW